MIDPSTRIPARSITNSGYPGASEIRPGSSPDHDSAQSNAASELGPVGRRIAEFSGWLGLGHSSWSVPARRRNVDVRTAVGKYRHPPVRARASNPSSLPQRTTLTFSSRTSTSSRTATAESERLHASRNCSDRRSPTRYGPSSRMSFPFWMRWRRYSFTKNSFF